MLIVQISVNVKAFVGSCEFSWAFGCDGTVLLPLLFRTSGITTLASCPGSYPSLLAYRALDPLMDLSSLLPGTTFAQFCGICLQAVVNASWFGISVL